MRIDYEIVRRQVQHIEFTIEQLNVDKKKLKNMYYDLPSIWQGEAADVFKNKLAELIQELEKDIREMSSIRDTIMMVAINIKRTDEKLSNEIGNGLSNPYIKPVSRKN